MMTMKMAMAVGLMAMTATTAFAGDWCTPIDGEGSTRDGIHRTTLGGANYCDNGDGFWHFDFYTGAGSLFLDGRLIFFNVL